MSDRMGRIRARLAELALPDRRRTEGVLQWIADAPGAMICFNLFLSLLFRYVQLKLKVYRLLQRVGLYKSELEEEGSLGLRSDESFPARPLRSRPRVLLIAEETIPQCFRYRVQQKLDQFERLGCDTEWLSWRNAVRARERIHFFDIVIFYRVPGFPDVLSTIKYANAINRIVIYDVDDLVFDRARLAEKFTGATGQLPEKEYEALLAGAELYLAALRLCPYGMASTPTLAKEIEEVIGKGRCYVIPNALDSEVFKVIASPLAMKDESKVRVFYGSGTRTHDEDFALVSASLCTLLERYPQLELVIVGYLTLPEVLHAFEDRIQRLPLMEFGAYLATLRYADISIAPLEPGIFADCKSEIKWLEAASFGIPSVVSKTTTYDEFITRGKDGFIAADDGDWTRHLSALIEDRELRTRIGAQASATARSGYGRTAMAERMKTVIQAVQQDALDRGQLYDASLNNRKRVLVVHALYPPETVGGATVVVINTVEDIRRRYGEDIDIMVLKSDLVGTAPYQIKEYTWNNVPVVTVGIPSAPDLEWKYRDRYLLDVFDEFLASFKPDLLHFHSMQRLTGTLLESAIKSGIPYLVTVHDAWWLSEHQFLLDEEGELVDTHQLNPLVAARTAQDAEAAIKRSCYLSGLLSRAVQVLAVSEYQARIYRENGLENVSVNKNGLPRIDAVSREAGHSGLLRIGYVGGICDHKGYYFLKEIVEAASLSHLQFVIIDLDHDDPDYRADSRWGASTVWTWGRQSPDGMDQFYNEVDVLVAPSIWPESFGLVTREAALRGLWVVAAEAGGLAEDVVTGVTGFTFPMRDAPALLEILQNLDQDADRYSSELPDVEVSRGRIRGLAEQVDELVGLYRKTMSNPADYAEIP